MSNHQNTSKFLSYVLRHDPKKFNIKLDSKGWAVIDHLIIHTKNTKYPLSYELILDIVKTCEKQRYELSVDGTRIRATQGHSIAEVDIDYPSAIPPVLLYHGTATKNLDSIKKQGLLPQNRNYVHLSTDYKTASVVGARHGELMMVQINAKQMLADGFTFYLSSNNVWLCKHVPSKYITFWGV